MSKVSHVIVDFVVYGYTYVMNNLLIFTDPSGYRPDLIFEEEEGIRRNIGSTNFNYFGWLQRSLSLVGWTRNTNDYWTYNWADGTYYNSETGETINPTIDYQRYKETIEPYLYVYTDKNAEVSFFEGAIAPMPDGTTYYNGVIISVRVSNHNVATNRGGDPGNNWPELNICQTDRDALLGGAIAAVVVAEAAHGNCIPGQSEPLMK